MLSLKRFIASLVVIGGCLMPASAQNGLSKGALFAGEDNVVVDWAHKLAEGFVSDRLRLPMICVRLGYCF